MRASQFAERVAIVGFILGAVLVSEGGGVLRLLGAVLGLGCVVWYASSGMYLRGWVGPSRPELVAREMQLQREYDQLDAEPDSPASQAQMWKTFDELNATRRLLAQHDNETRH